MTASIDHKIYHALDTQLRQQIKAHLDALGTEINTLLGLVASDTAYGASWNGVTTIPPSKNAVYDKIETITSNVTHTGEVTGATALTVDKTAISNRSTVTVAATDTILIGDASDSDNLKKIAASDFVRSASLAANVATFLATPSSANLAAALTNETGTAGTVPFYSSGSFTPTILDDTLSDAESQTYTARSGQYVRIGNLIAIWVDITVNSLGTLTTTQQAKIGGLPFQATFYAPVYCSFAESLNIVAGVNVGGNIPNAVSYINLHKWDQTYGTSNMTLAELSAGGHLLMSATYVTS